MKLHNEGGAPNYKNKVVINYQGHSFNSYSEWDKYLKQEALKSSCDMVVWDYCLKNNKQVFVNGKMIPNEGKQEYGKCTYKGKTYEGEVEHIKGKLYVGGQFVKQE